MTTFGELVTQILNALHSFTGYQEQVTWLTEGCDSSVTTVSVFDGEEVTRGTIEVGDELMRVASVSANTVTIAPFGRGYMGSTATAHLANDKVVNHPLFPRVEVKRAIKQVMAAFYPRLYQIKEATFTYSGPAMTWELPADAEGIVKVQYEVSGGSLYWAPVVAWEFHKDAETATGRAVTLHGSPEQGATVKVTYRAAFGVLSADADTMTSVGFPESAVDVLLYGVAAQLIRFLDMARLQTTSVENMTRSQLVQSGDPSKVANQLYAMYVTRLEEERKKLLELDPPQMHYTR